MKQLILGNEAVARGLYEAGCSFVSSYPGTPSTEITEAVAKYPRSMPSGLPMKKLQWRPPLALLWPVAAVFAA